MDQRVSVPLPVIRIAIAIVWGCNLVFDDAYLLLFGLS